MRRLLLLVVACMFSTAMFAQLSSPISFGLHAGLVSTKVEAKYPSIDDIKENSKNGSMFGVFARINLGKWYVQPELNYVSRKSEVATPDDAVTVKIKSLDVPMLLGYKLLKIPMFKLRAFVGPVASFKLDDDVSFTKAVTNKWESPSFKGAVWNGKVGAGVDVWKLTLDVDYEFGLSNVSDEFLKKNKMFNVTLGFKIF